MESLEFGGEFFGTKLESENILVVSLLVAGAAAMCFPFTITHV